MSEPDDVASNRVWTATDSEYTDAQADRNWARKWPAEEIWAARKPS